MNNKECKIFFEVSTVSDVVRNRKYIDGLAFTKGNVEYLKELSSIIGEFNEVLLIEIELEDVLQYILDTVNHEGFRILLAIPNVSEVVTMKQSLAHMKGNNNIILGLNISKPILNISNYARQGVKFVLMPPALIRVRLISEAKARGLEIIARPVNDVTTFINLFEQGVDAVVTKNPLIKRESKKLLKL